VISANARAADRWRSTLSEKERVVSAARGEPVKKLVVVRSERMSDEVVGDGRAMVDSLSRYCRRSATASRSFSRSRGS